MGQIQAEIENAINQTNTRATLMSEEDSVAIFKAVESRFAKPRAEGALWDRLVDSVGCRDVDGWRWLAEFRPADACVMFVPPHLESRAFKFERCRDIAAVLAACSGFVVYVAGMNLEYLLCFNDHDYVIACGAAISWLTSRCAETQKSQTQQ